MLAMTQILKRSLYLGVEQIAKSVDLSVSEGSFIL